MITFRDFQRLLGRVRTQIANMVSRAVVQLVDDSTKMQLIQATLLDGEARSGLERFQNYGFTSVPQPGAEAAIVFVNGFRDHGLVLAIDDRRYRLTSLQPGEVALYTDQGDSIVIKRGGNVEVTAATQVMVNAPLATFSGNMTVAGDVTVTGAVAAATMTAGTVTGTTDVSGGGKSLATHTHSPGSFVAGATHVTGVSGSPS